MPQHPQLARTIEQQLHRRPDRDIAAHGRVDGDQGSAGGILQGNAPMDVAVQNGLAVFDLADLKKGHLLGTADEIAFRIEQENIRALIADLAAEDKGGSRVHHGPCRST